ncbi:hypothetical protein BASA83_010218 [Batrachochytrium salamandrivorans]|nr:hypothetical protein BASA83_010218 [Batrachochytrium salamandrivorans]
MTDLVIRQNSGIPEIPDSIGLLSSLKNLDSQGCSIRILADNIGQLHDLIRLDLRRNQLSSFAIPYTITEWKSITHLYLGYNAFEIIPEEICELYSLVELDISFNALVSLPKQISKLTQLVKLCLNNNKIEGLIPEISSLKALQVLEIRHNVLSRLPPEIGELSSLLKLDASENHLIDLPPELYLLEGIVLEVKGNHFDATMQEHILKGSDHLMKVLRKRT